MPQLSLLIVLSFLFFGCNDAKPHQKAVDTRPPLYPTVSYLDIKLDAGQLPANPYVLEFEGNGKKIVFCGVNHLTDYGDTANPLFTGIENKFFAFKPEVAVNEGGDVSGRRYASRQEAIRQNGEIGLTKILCDSLKIKTTDGDPSLAFECEALLHKYTNGELIAYLATERLMWSLKGGPLPDSGEIEKAYSAFIQDYLMKEGGVKLTGAEQSFSFYKLNYQQLLGRPFSLETLEPTNPFERGSRFQEIGRASKEIRDQYLLQTIDRLLDNHNKVFVVFGGWHLLTCQPGLDAIVKRKRG